MTNWIDHEPPKRGNDGTAILWDGIVGRRAELKDKALVLLSK